MNKHAMNGHYTYIYQLSTTYKNRTTFKCMKLKVYFKYACSHFKINIQNFKYSL